MRQGLSCILNISSRRETALISKLGRDCQVAAPVLVSPDLRGDRNCRRPVQPTRTLPFWSTLRMTSPLALTMMQGPVPDGLARFPVRIYYPTWRSSGEIAVGMTRAPESLSLRACSSVPTQVSMLVTLRTSRGSRSAGGRYAAREIASCISSLVYSSRILLYESTNRELGAS